ncbi:hypothetical protein QZH41_018323 [Actinostola sp. cb2023]|nr:hypothetical protein QZH41_018323 [Actinostola sp. cb2023]
MAAFFSVVSFQNRRAIRRERVFRDRTNVLDTLNNFSIIERYRLSREMIFRLIDEVKDKLEPPTKRSHAVPTQLQVLVALRYYAKGGFLSEVGDIHGVSRSSASRAIHRVTNALYEVHKDELIYPANVDDIKSGFYGIAGMPNVVGCIDGTLIPIQAPSIDEHVFVCRKGLHAINVQAVVDYKQRFINCVCKWPGSVNDSFILQNSAIFASFERGDIDGWLLGDSGYPLKSWLLTPVSIPSTSGEERYNTTHKKTRNVVERAFGILKSRFRCLHKSTGCLLFNPERSCKVIYVCFILHNMCTNKKLPLHENVDVVEEEEDNALHEEQQDGKSARESLIQLRFTK